MTLVHGSPPQTLGWPPPPQVWGATHVPHWRRSPQPSPAGPQSKPCWAQVLAVHVGGGGGTCGVMHDARSKSMNSSSFSWAVSGVPSGAHSVGKSPLPDRPMATWKSLKRTRPHWFAERAPTGVLNV